MKRLISKWPILVLFAVSTTLIYKTLFLGFYHDDWATIVGATLHGNSFSSERFQWLFSLFLSRPIGGIITFLGSSLNSKSPLLWQTTIAFFSFWVIAFQYIFLKRLAAYLNFPAEKPRLLLFSGLLFIVPWTIGGFNFVTAGIVILPAMLFFLVSGCLILKSPEKIGIYEIIWSSVFYILSCLTYEIFYFQFLVFILILLIKSVRRIHQKLFLLAGSLLFAQMLAITWNRYLTPLWGTDPRKNFHESWLTLFANSFFNLPINLLSALELNSLTTCLLLLVILFMAFIALRTLSRKYTKFLLIPLFGLIISLLLYSFVGYEISSTGIFSRTTVTPVFYLILAFWIIDNMIIARLKRSKIIYNLGVTFLVIILLLATWRQIFVWQVSWDIQKKVLNTFPYEKLPQTDDQALILYYGPFEIRGVIVFSAWWDIQGAVNSRVNHTNLHRRYSVARPEWTTSWKPEIVKQSWKQSAIAIWEIPASEIWLWNYYDKTFIRLAAEGTI